MDKKEEMLNYLNEIADLAIMQLREREGYESYEVTDIKYSGEMICIDKETGEQITMPRVDISAADINDKKANIRLTYVGEQELDQKFLEKYEVENPIKDKVGEKTEGNEEHISDSTDKQGKEEHKREESEDEKKQEEKEEDDDEKDKDAEESQSKKRKPKYVIEKVNPDKAQMDYWQTVKQACGLPEKVHTLAFSYPTSSEDKVDYADITVYMLDKDGYIIDDFDVDDYFEFDSSTGNNPLQDDVVRHEKDENEGKAQIEEHRTMIRLYAKNSEDKNTYISLEQKNGIGDYNDINAGRKTVAGTQNVEKQLETDRVVKDWDSDEEKLMNSYAGKYNMNEIFEEAEKHEKHGDEEYVSTLNADGNQQTAEMCRTKLVPDTSITWEQFSKSVGDRNIEELQKDFFEQYNGNNGQELILKIQADYKEKENCKQTEEIDRRDNEDEEGPWRYAGSRERKH